VPIVRTSFEPFSASTRPPWSAITAAGLLSVSPGGRFDCHFHDCHEYWLVFGGRARIQTEGIVCDVGPGDIVCTRAGDGHGVLAVWGEFRAFSFGDSLPPGGRAGHLHRETGDAAGHLDPGLDASESFQAGEHERG
jgi:mannose-6-phosphate isomerase-like protein (cupin superfamily)